MLEREVTRQTSRFEMYGGNDIHEPDPKSIEEKTSPLSSFLPEDPVDPNMVTWDGPEDPANPQNWSTAWRWWITLVCAIMTINVTFASSAPTSAVFAIQAQFQTSSEVSYLVTTVFLLGYTFGPFLWGPGSELIGRRPVFWLTMTLYTVFHIGQARAQNMQTLLVTRFLCGFFAVAPLTNCGGVIADIWSAVGRGPATSVFTLCVFLGTTIAPIACGYIVESSLGWRWVFWIMMIFAGTCTTIMFIMLPETYVPVLLAKKATRLRKEDPVKYMDLYAEHERQDWSFKGVLHRTILRPFHMLMVEPILILITIYVSLVYGVLYALFEAFPIIFMEQRGFTIAQDGLVFIGIGIGTTLGAFINALTCRHYPQLVVKWKGFPPPEERLFAGMIGGPVLVIGIFWLGWTGNYPSVSWVAPAVSTIFIGASIALIFMSCLGYLVDTYVMYSASAFSVNTIIRSAVASSFPLFTVQMFHNLHINWACTMLGLIALLLAPVPFLFYKYGPRIRQKSKFAPCVDLKVAKLLAVEEAAQKTSDHEKV
ncbi:MFS general substrate transporter [Fistulina hepatica ATCC 64428]|uniref:MFS general substrate transporter n=1 Tax=Fistulina hepatica ATCC 64428 TaxID=1128425 RepID=A0A0D7AN17_9AGAR|nr:MFS general substrate transporter [Fistulina hepatica ATCC 64428]